MKVAHIETIYSTGGGTPRIVLSLIHALEKDGGKGIFLHGRGTATKPEDVAITRKVCSEMSLKLHYLRSRLFDSSALGSVGDTKKLVEFLREYDPDVIHLHSLLGYYVDIRTLFAYLATAGKPVVWTQHDCWAFTGHCIHFVCAHCEKWKTECYRCPQKHTYPNSLFLDRSRRNFRLKKKLFNSVPDLTIVTPSRWLAGLVKESFLGGHPIHVIPNGIDLTKYHPTESDLRERYEIGNRTLLLSVAATWSPTKGRDHLLRLWEQLDPEKYRLVMIGSVPQKETLPEGVLSLPRTKTVDELIEWYSAADVFLNTTLSDNFPTVNIEALACGIPVITYPTGGSVEAIDEKSGIVTDAQTPEAMLRAIRQWEEHPFAREDCLARAKRFDADARYADYVRLYYELVKK